jgi:hydroxyethylthiazole kinase
MLISPPFLLPRAENQSEDEWLNAAMAGDAPGHGAFPVSFNLGWHGGLHLAAPVLGTGFEPVRAIADGNVTFIRQPTAGLPNLAVDHPLMYNNATSDGVVVIRHETEIGDGNNAAVTFYSVYVHLHEIPATVRSGQPVYRKDVVGRAGYINGERGRIHFEIICDDANLARLTGRATEELGTEADGRVDAVYGEIYFRLPSGTQIYAQKPLLNSATAFVQPPRPPHAPHNAPLPPPQPAPQVHTTAEELIIGLHYAGGEGTDGQRGNASVTTYRPDGSELGAAIEVPDAEYKLYSNANTIAEAYPAAIRPAPSAVYEVLRFGRVIGSDQLRPADVPHWQQIRYLGGQGWVNLNATGVQKFSDADFPHWKQWRILDDHTGGDSRCDSTVIRNWLDVNGDGKVSHAEASERLSSAEISPKLARVIVKFPTEWDGSTIDARWGWLKSSTPENLEPLSDEDFQKLRAHIGALAFWPGGVEIDSNHWHWNPREFIRHFRKCGWLNVRELAQCIPRRCMTGTTDWNTALQRATRHRLPLNRFFRKYYGASRQRHIHSLAQIYIETGMLSLMEEGGAGSNKPYGPLYGRGYMQLTWGTNYEKYGEYKALARHHGPYTDMRITSTSTHAKDSGGSTMQWFPRYDPDVIASDLNHAGESSGFFWVTKRFRGTTNMNRVADLPFSLTAVGFASWLVNGGGNGYANRQQFALFLKNHFLDEPFLTGNVPFRYPPLTPNVNLGTAAKPNWSPLLCSRFPPVEVPFSSTGNINYEFQRP